MNVQSTGTAPVAFPTPALHLDQPAASQIHNALRAAILSVSLPPGTRLSEGETGTRFGASRTPVREALTWLRDEGLVETLPSRGNFVTRLSVAAIREAHIVCLALQSAVVTHICEAGLSSANENALAMAMVAQRKARAKDDAGAAFTAYSTFQTSLAHATGIERLSIISTREKTALDRLVALWVETPEGRAAIEDDHRRILNALRDANAKKAQRLVARHLSGILDALDGLRSEHPDYFQ